MKAFPSTAALLALSLVSAAWTAAEAPKPARFAVIGTRISQSAQSGSKGRFTLKEPTKGDYQLTADLGSAHAAPRFSLGSSCAAELGKVMLLEGQAPKKPANGGESAGGSGNH